MSSFMVKLDVVNERGKKKLKEKVEEEKEANRIHIAEV